MTIENRTDKIIPRENKDSNNEDELTELHIVTRSERISKLCDYGKYFLETVHLQISSNNNNEK